MRNVALAVEKAPAELGHILASRGLRQERCKGEAPRRTRADGNHAGPRHGEIRYSARSAGRIVRYLGTREKGVPGLNAAQCTVGLNGSSNCVFEPVILASGATLPFAFFAKTRILSTPDVTLALAT
jgi:hypothetical protein